MVPLKLTHILEQAKRNSTVVRNTVVRLNGTLFTPKTRIELIGIEGLGGVANFLDTQSHAESIIVKGRIQPGVYMKHVLPYKDQLTMEICVVNGLEQTAQRYQCTPLLIVDTNKESNATGLVNPEALDVQNFITVDFQLIDLAYYAMRNLTVADSFLLGNIGDCLHSVLADTCDKIEYDGMATYEGIKMKLPVDNQRVYQQLVFPQGTQLNQVVSYAQEKYGIYSDGAGSFFRDGYWYVFSFWDYDSYDSASEKIDILKVPEDVMPTLNESYYSNGEHTSIIVTGEAQFQSKSDIDHQNRGTGQQIISSDTIAGVTGTHYNAGRAITTRQDSVSEYRTVERGTGANKDKVTVNPNFTNNLCREISNSRSADGDIMVVQWDNADFTKLTPGVPVKYLYMNPDQTLMARTGKLVGYQYSYIADGVQGVLKFRRYAKLIVFLTLDEKPES